MKRLLVYGLVLCSSLLSSCAGGGASADAAACAGVYSVTDTAEHYWQDSLHIWVLHLHDSCHVVSLEVHGELRDTMVIRHPVYRFTCGDLTGDGLPEVGLGVIKRTRYWSSPDRRLFLYRLFRGHFIRPLWLGSRVGYQLEDFEICRDSVPACIFTRERQPDASLRVGQYRLSSGFGLRFVRYCK